MTPIQLAAFQFVADRRVDRTTGRHKEVSLDEISEPMRQRIIDLAMMEPPLVDLDGPRVFLTGCGYIKLNAIRAGRRCETNVVEHNGDCIACGAANGEACRAPPEKRGSI